MQSPNQNRSYTIDSKVDDLLTIIDVNTRIVLTAEASESLAKALQGECQLNDSSLVNLFKGLTQDDVAALHQLSSQLLLGAAIIRARRNVD